MTADALAAQVCDLAADIIATDGLCKWEHTDATGAHCMTGAIVAATLDLKLMFVPRDAWFTLRDLVLDRLGDGQPAAFKFIAPALVCEWWTDLEETTQADVEDVLRMGAKVLAPSEPEPPSLGEAISRYYDPATVAQMEADRVDDWWERRRP